MKLLLLLQLSVSLILVHGCPKAFERRGNKEDSECQESDVSEAYMDFAVKIYSYISSKPARAPPNVFFSPLSIYTSLSMLSLGARSTTRKEILQGMGLSASKTDKELHGDISKLLRVLNQPTGGDRFKLGNNIFIEQQAEIERQYQQDLISYYNASIQALCFSDDQAERTINKLISDRTNDKIKELVKNLDFDTLMVFVDYTVFQANWKSEFDPENTEPKKFFVHEGKSVSVPMMCRKGTYKTYKDKDDNSVVVEVPYAGNMVLLLVVPQQGDLYRVEQTLTPEKIKNYFSSTKTSVLDLSLPKVIINTPVNVEFALQFMGFGNIFNGDKADFSRMTKQPKVKVSEILHQSYVNIAEEGTKAFAATDSQAKFVYTNPKFVVDRPYLMFIYHKVTETVVWMGHGSIVANEVYPRRDYC